MLSKNLAIAIAGLLLVSVSAGAARADANDDYNQCTALPDQQASYACIEKLAQSGNATAQLALGGFYAGGQGVPQNAQQAAYWYQKAAEQGNAVAMSKLGDAYLTGNGVTQDDGKAASWFARAASAGDPWSLEMLGSLYEQGKGVGQDYVTAYQWYDVAAAEGVPQAATQRDDLAQKMTAAQIATAKQRSSEWLAQSATRATAGKSAALSKAVDECVAVVRGTNQSLYYTNFQAAYRPETGTIEIMGAQEQGPVAAFDHCMAAKGYSVRATTTQ